MKNLLPILAILLSTLPTFAQTAHTIGDHYGGGIVFYVYDNGQHGLIASMADQSTKCRWHGGTNTATGANATGIGGGLKNTIIIIANQAAIDGKPFAARLCNEYTEEAYGDWYLPAIHELRLLFYQKKIVGGFSEDFYWSSTEWSGYNKSRGEADDPAVFNTRSANWGGNYAQIYLFDDIGKADYDHKEALLAVRAIRAF